MIKYLY